MDYEIELKGSIHSGAG